MKQLLRPLNDTCRTAGRNVRKPAREAKNPAGRHRLGAAFNQAGPDILPHAFIRAVKIETIPKDLPPRSFGDYKVTVDKNVPKGVEIIEKL